eukprot:16911-Heterococcus_DN1.PRE.1
MPRMCYAASDTQLHNTARTMYYVCYMYTAPNREGHRAPPKRVRYYGNSTTAADADAGGGDALCILSAGTDRAFRLFHTVRDALNTELSQKPLVKVGTMHRVTAEGFRLRPIIAFDSCETRARDWCNIVTCHEEDANAYVWMYKNR